MRRRRLLANYLQSIHMGQREVMNHSGVGGREIENSWPALLCGPAAAAINRRSSAPSMAKAIPVDSTIFAKRARHTMKRLMPLRPQSRHAVLDDVLAGVHFDIHIGCFGVNYERTYAVSCS